MPDPTQAAWSDGLPRARPDAHGVDPGRVQAFLDEAARLGVELHSFMLWRTGHVVAEGWWWPYRPDRRHMMHSATKSFLSAAVGLAVAEGRFSLWDRVVDFFDDHRPARPSPSLAVMTIEDLLTQTSGHAQGASGSVWRSIRTSWIDEFFKIPVAFEPGTRFRYTSATSFLLSAIVSRTTGQKAHDHITPRLLQPLGIAGLEWDAGQRTSTLAATASAAGRPTCSSSRCCISGEVLGMAGNSCPRTGSSVRRPGSGATRMATTGGPARAAASTPMASSVSSPSHSPATTRCSR